MREAGVAIILLAGLLGGCTAMQNFSRGFSGACGPGNECAKAYTPVQPAYTYQPYYRPAQPAP